MLLRVLSLFSKSADVVRFTLTYAPTMTPTCSFPTPTLSTPTSRLSTYGHGIGDHNSGLRQAESMANLHDLKNQKLVYVDIWAKCDRYGEEKGCGRADMYELTNVDVQDLSDEEDEDKEERESERGRGI